MMVITKNQLWLTEIALVNSPPGEADARARCISASMYIRARNLG